MVSLYKAKGGGSIGFWFGASWPFANIEVFEDKVCLDISVKKAEIPLDSIRYVERLMVGLFFPQAIYLEIDNGGDDRLPSFITFNCFSFKKMDELDKLLKEICKKQLPERPWYKKIYHKTGFAFLAAILLFILLSNLI